MLFGFLLLVVVAIADAGAFVGARWLVARRVGVEGRLGRLGIQFPAWEGVSFGRRLAFTLAGPAALHMVTILLFTMGALLLGKPTIDEASMRVTVAATGAAATAGFVDGDRVVSVEGEPIASWPSLKDAIAKRAGEPTRVVVKRGEETLTLTPTPSASGKIGVGPPVGHAPIGLGEAIGHGITEPAKVWGTAFKGAVRTFSAREPVEATGPIGIVREVGGGRGPDRFGAGTKLVAILNAYFFWLPCLLALLIFPRPPKRRA